MVQNQENKKGKTGELRGKNREFLLAPSISGLTLVVENLSNAHRIEKNKKGWKDCPSNEEFEEDR